MIMFKARAEEVGVLGEGLGFDCGQAGNSHLGRSLVLRFACCHILCSSAAAGQEIVIVAFGTGTFEAVVVLRCLQGLG